MVGSKQKLLATWSYENQFDRVLKFNIVMPFRSQYFLSSQTNRKRKVCTHESSKKKCWLWHKVGIENLSSFHTIMLHSYPSQGTLPQGIEFLSK